MTMQPSRRPGIIAKKKAKGPLRGFFARYSLYVNEWESSGNQRLSEGWEDIIFAADQYQL
jgi:hypothetical protein